MESQRMVNTALSGENGGQNSDYPGANKEDENMQSYLNWWI
jgi:hypothetical protein